MAKQGDFMEEHIIGIISCFGGITAVAMTFLQIAPIKVNPWSYLAKRFGRAINGEVIEKVDKLDKDLQTLRSECDEREAALCRTHILHFGDEILHDVRHSKEHFDQILIDITMYEDYCESHPKFKNNIAAATIDRIKQVYIKCMDESSFL